MLKKAIAMSLEEHPRVEKEESQEEIIISDQQPGEHLGLLVASICI